MGFGMAGGMGWGWLFGLLLLIGVIVLVVVAVRALTGGVERGGDPRAGRPTSSARQILDERYARGELSTQEYQERLRALGDGPG